MFDKIIVTTDLSEEATRAYAVTKELAQKHNSSITLLHVIDTSFLVAYPGIIDMPVVVSPGAIDDVRSKVEEQLKNDISKYFSDVAVTLEIGETVGSPHLAIAELVKKMGGNLLIMTTHGRSGIKRALLGSVTELVIRHSNFPILLVPSK